ncbi:MAG: hypothetical protein AAGA93_00605 [Actinomycetota bacterium]
MSMYCGEDVPLTSGLGGVVALVATIVAVAAGIGRSAGAEWDTVITVAVGLLVAAGVVRLAWSVHCLRWANRQQALAATRRRNQHTNDAASVLELPAGPVAELPSGLDQESVITAMRLRGQR